MLLCVWTCCRFQYTELSDPADHRYSVALALKGRGCGEHATAKRAHRWHQMSSVKRKRDGRDWLIGRDAAPAAPAAVATCRRAEEARDGKEWVSPGRIRWWAEQEKK